MTPMIFFNGAFVPRDAAHVGVHNGGWLHGAGLFETMRAENGRVFRLRAHLDRLSRSAEALLRPVDPAWLPDDAVVSNLLDRCELDTARVRLTVTAGSMIESSGSEPGGLTVCMTAARLDAPPQAMYERGVRAALCDHRVSPSDPIAGHKTTSYLPRLLGLRAAKEKGCFDALWFTTSNQLAEGSISNVFVVKGGMLITPPLSIPVLAGIARATVIESARAEDRRVEERALTGDDVLDADEVFLTNAIVQVLPVVGIERHVIGDGTVGSVARAMLASYRNLVRKECSR